MKYKDIFYKNDKIVGNRLSYNWIKKYHSYIIDEIELFVLNNNLLIDDFNQKKFHFFYNIIEKPKCKVCSKEVKFKSFTFGYYKTCGVECKNILKKINTEKTSLEKYGTKHHLANKDVIKKRSKTVKDKYGTDNVFQSELIKKKIKTTFLNRYNVDNAAKDENIQKKIQKTNFKRYGVKYSLSHPDIIKKREATNLKRYGVKNIYQSKLIYDRKLNKRINFFKDLAFKDYNIINVTKDRIITIKCEKCNKTYSANSSFLLQRQQFNVELCLNCNPLHNLISSYEKELSEWLTENNIKHKCSDRTLISPLEIDIYIEEYNIALEVNGLYWHSELYKDKTYHFNKTKLALEKGVKLIHIWEDDWVLKRDIVKSRILNLLNKTPNKVFARKTKIKEVNNKESIKFLSENHLQGKINSKINIGLYYDNELISLMNFSNLRINLGQKHKENSFELIRFTNKINYNVVGAASKLFKHFLKTHKINNIISYANIDWTSDPYNNLYTKLNFMFDSSTPYGYYWWKNGKYRENRFKYRKDILVKEGADPNMTEVEIMHSKGYYRIFNSGNYKYVYRNNNNI